jgi:hypothetical protein
MDNISELIGKYGFPIVSAAGMGYFIFYVWTWVTKEIKPVLGEASAVLIALIDRVRMLDNDLIRLNQKINIVLMMREVNKKDEEINKNVTGGNYRHDDDNKQS